MNHNKHQTKTFVATSEALGAAASLLRSGDVVGIPTETVYGLAGNAYDDRAVAQIFAVKERPTFDPLIVHVARRLRSLQALAAANLIDLAKLTAAMAATTEKLIQSFWPGPLTVILPKGHAVSDLVTSGLPQVALRMPSHPVATALLEMIDFPLAAPSANRFGRISPTSAAAVLSELSGRIPLILDGGPCEVGIESTVVRIGEDGQVIILRPGGLSREDLERGLASSVIQFSESRTTQNHPAPSPSPGMLLSHYAPTKPLKLLPISEMDLLTPATHAGPLGILICEGDSATAEYRWRKRGFDEVSVLALSSNGHSIEAARNLFRHLRALDASKAERLLAERPRSGEGLWPAITDRLKRAAGGER